MVELRVLTDEGIDLFRTFLDESARSGEPAPCIYFGIIPPIFIQKFT